MSLFRNLNDTQITITAKLIDKILPTEPFLVSPLSFPCRNAGTASPAVGSTGGFAWLFQTRAGQLCSDICAWQLEGPLQAQGSAFVKQFSEYWSLNGKQLLFLKMINYLF